MSTSTPTISTQRSVPFVLFPFDSIGRGAKCWIRRPDGTSETVVLDNIDMINRKIYATRLDGTSITEEISDIELYRESYVEWQAATKK